MRRHGEVDIRILHRRAEHDRERALEHLQSSDHRYLATIDQQSFAWAGLITVVYAVVLRLLCYGRWM